MFVNYALSKHLFADQFNLKDGIRAAAICDLKSLFNWHQNERVWGDDCSMSCYKEEGGIARSFSDDYKMEELGRGKETATIVGNHRHYCCYYIVAQTHY